MTIVAWFARGLLRWTGGRVFTGRLFGDREELRRMMQDSAPSLTTEENLMINRVLDLQNFRVKHVSVPIAKTVTVPPSALMAQVLTLCRERNLTRLPVLDPATAKIVGVLDMEELIYQADLDPKKKAAHYMRPALFLAGNLLLEDAVRRLAVIALPQHGEQVWHDEQRGRCSKKQAADHRTR